MEAFVGKFERTEQKNYEEFLKVWTINFVTITINNVGYQKQVNNNKIFNFLGFGREHTVEKGSIDLDPNHGGVHHIVVPTLVKTSQNQCVLYRFMERKQLTTYSKSSSQISWDLIQVNIKYKSKVSVEQGTWTIKQSTTLKTMEIKFKVY